MDVATPGFARRVLQLRTPALPPLLALVPPCALRLDAGNQIRQPLARLPHFIDQAFELVLISLLLTSKRERLVERGVGTRATWGRGAAAPRLWRSFEQLRC